MFALGRADVRGGDFRGIRTIDGCMFRGVRSWFLVYLEGLEINRVFGDYEKFVLSREEAGRVRYYWGLVFLFVL